MPAAYALVLTFFFTSGAQVRVLHFDLMDIKIK